MADSRAGLRPGAAFFYGVVDETRALFDRARSEGRDWYYADNSYFDRGRQAFFRVTKNAFQVTQIPTMQNYKRARLCGLYSSDLTDWRVDGKHIVICEQSKQFMNLVGYKDNWVEEVCWELNRFTTRELRIRRWSRDKGKLAQTLKSDLVDAWALVTHMSAAANEAIIRGIPAFVTGACAALPVASGRSFADLRDIERPSMGTDRSRWTAGLVSCQWTLDEIRSGVCWETLNEKGVV